jgi:protein SCO1/2
VFVKIVVILLLLIVAASLLAGRGGRGTASRPRAALRVLMLRVALVLLALSAAVAAFHFLVGEKPGVAFRATDVTGAAFGRLAALDGLTDHTGRRVASADFRDKATVVFFGYTQCPDICPTALATYRDVLRLLAADAARVQVLFVSVDPERDTQEVLAGYVPWFDPRFLGLRGDAQATRAAAREFRVYYDKVDGDSALGYGIDHTATSYIHDPAGRIRLLVRDGAPAAEIAADLRKLLAGA